MPAPASAMVVNQVLHCHQGQRKGLLGQRFGISAKLGSRRLELIEENEQWVLQNRDRIHELWLQADEDGGGTVDLAELKEILIFSFQEFSLQVKTPVGDQDLELLMRFCEQSRFGEVDEVEFVKLLSMWWMVTQHVDAWLDQLPLSELHRDSVLSLMRHLNGSDSRVCMREAQWVMEIVAEIVQHPTQKVSAVMFALAYWIIEGRAEPRRGLLREKLIERLTLERILTRDWLRLTNFFMLFVLFISALRLSTMSDPCRGIQENLQTRYHLDNVKEVTTLADVRDFLRQFSSSSAALAPLSQAFFSQGAELKLLSEERTFSEPAELPYNIDFWIARAFTLQAWIGLEPGTIVPPRGLTILRKALECNEACSPHSCWSWNFPPSLAYGAHDFGGSQPEEVAGLYQERTSVPYPLGETAGGGGLFGETSYEETQTLVLHTLVVNSSHATFYVGGGVVVGVVPLRRPLTDCASPHVLLGDAGLRLASVDFLPRALSAREVREIYRAGSLLADMGYVIRAKEVGSLSQVDALRYELQRSSLKSNDLEGVRKEIKSNAALTAEAVRNPAHYPVAYSGGVEDVQQDVDRVLGYPTWTIVGRETFVNATSLNLRPGDSLPKVSAPSGFALSVWLNFSNTAGDGYLITRSMPREAWGGLDWVGESSMCWQIYVGGGSTYFYLRSRDAGSTYGHSVDDDAVPPEWRFRGQAYRHFVFQVRKVGDRNSVEICIDGVCQGQDDAYRYDTVDPAESPVDCEGIEAWRETYDSEELWQDALNTSYVWVGSRPNHVWPFTGSIMNFKAFDRSLSHEEIEQLFDYDADSEGKLMRRTRGCRNPEELSDDVTWRDEFGQDCFWYYRSRHLGFSNCDRSPEARYRCPVACQSVEMCWGTGDYTRTNTSMQIWPQQMEFRSQGTWGTTCVAKSTTAAKEAIKCGLGATNIAVACDHLGIRQCAPVNCSDFEHDEAALLQCLDDVVWTSAAASSAAVQELTRNDYMPCAEIIRTHVPECDWDDSGLEEVAMTASKRWEWSMTFWMEPLSTQACLHPQMRLINGDGVQFSRLGGWESVVVDPPGGPGCQQSTWLQHTLVGRASHGYPDLAGAEVRVTPEGPGMKHLIVFGLFWGQVALHYDTASNFDDVKQHGGVPPIEPGAGFLRAINILGDLRLSPITLAATYPSSGQVSKVRYSELDLQQQKVGPVETLHEQLKKHRTREVGVFTEKPFLVSPPLIAQTRRKAKECSWFFSDHVVQTYVRRGKERRCSEPYQCSDYDAHHVYQCPGEREDGMFFGLESQEFMGKQAYVEFLATITDHSIVVRQRDFNESSGREIMLTNQFLDTLTEEVSVLATFYSVEFGITTNLLIRFDTTSGRVHGGYDIRHYVALTGDHLQEYTYMQASVVICLLIMLADSIYLTYMNYLCWKEGQPLENAVFTIVLDIAIQVSTVIFLGLVINARSSSGDYTEEFVGGLLDMEWSTHNEDSVAEKKAQFIKIVKALMHRIWFSQIVESFGMVIVLCIFLRVIMATSAHPRIALITETLKYAMSDMMHFSIIFLLIIWGFAAVGTWRFGAKRADLKDPFTAMRTQFDAILDPPGDLILSGTDDPDYEFLVYVFLLHVFNFFFLVNFFLAIVVQAYSRTMEGIDRCDVEQDIMRDLWAIVRYNYNFCKHQWPSYHKVLRHLRTLTQRYVTAEDLLPSGFGSEAAAEAYFSFYGRFDFLAEQDGAEDGRDQLDLSDKLDMTNHKLNSVIYRLENLGLAADEQRHSTTSVAQSRHSGFHPGCMSPSRSFHFPPDRPPPARSYAATSSTSNLNKPKGRQKSMEL